MLAARAALATPPHVDSRAAWPPNEHQQEARHGEDPGREGAGVPRIASARRRLCHPHPWDIGSARIMAAQGFEALATTSLGMALSLGKRDGEVSRDDVLAHC